MLQQSYSDFEVIVVCDGENADVREISNDYEREQRVRWIFHDNNRGLPAARNTGARAASGDVVLFLDDDVVANKELIAAHMKLHQAADPERKVAVSSLTVEDRDTPLTSFVNHCLHENWKRSIDAYSSLLSATGVESVSEEVEGIVWFGLNCSIRRGLFLSFGGFNEHFRVSDEERELGLRLHLAGVEFIFESRILLTHKNSKDLDSYFRKCWGASGELDVHRVFVLGERNSQTKHLVSMFHGYMLNRFAARTAWHLSGWLRTLSIPLETVADRTGLHALFGAWARTCQQAEYWSHVKATGCNLKRLKGVVGPSKRALMLHSICEPLSAEEATYYIGPRRFSRMMRWFRAMGYKTAKTAQWLQNEMSERDVLLTFDDGYDDLYEELLPRVIEHRYTPVIYLVAERIGASNVWDQARGVRARNLLTLAQIREMQKHGVEFGSHSLTHAWLPDVSDAQLRREVRDSKSRLEDMLGVEVTSFAYPFGGVDRRVRSAVADAGYKLAFTTLPGLNWWNDPLCQRRAEINDHTTALDFVFKLRRGLGFTESISTRIRCLEQELPTRRLRNLAGGLRGIGHQVVHMFARDAQYNSKS